MKFAELLREYTEGMTLDQVAKRCAEIGGVQVHTTYLSKLRTGDRPAPDSDDMVAVLAAACGKPAEPLLLLARYERSPQRVMEELIDSWVQLDFLRERVLDDFMNERAYVATQLETKEHPSTIQFEMRSRDYWLHQKLEAMEGIRRALLERIELLSDRRRIQEAAPGTLGTFTQVGEDDWRKRTSVLIARLAAANNIPVTSLWAAVATAKAAQDPKFNVADWIAKELHPHTPGAAEASEEV